MRNTIFFLVVFAFFALPFRPFRAEAAATVFGDATVSRIIRVYDGDTFRCDIQGFPPVVGENIGIRIAGIDTPELRDKREHIKAKAVMAREYAKERLLNAKVVELRNLMRGKYFRLVADVFVDGTSLGEALLDAGLAHPYDGGTKIPWE